jgi:hypothetical protein
MNWKKWRIGMGIAIVCGVFNAGAGLAGTMDWKSFVAVLCASLLTNLGNFLKQHPIESVDDGYDRRAHVPLALLCAGLALAAGSGGCRIPQPPKDAILSATVRRIGISVNQNPATQIPELNLGYFSGTYHRVPTGTTNAPAVDSGIDLSQSGFSTGIHEQFRTGGAAVRGTNVLK